MRIVFDLDGVLVDFILGFTTLANRMYGTPVYSTSEQKEWNRFNGLTPEQIGGVWERITTLPFFWQDLYPLVDRTTLGGVSRLVNTHDVYFVTSRNAAPGVKHQTEAWLRRHLLIDTPTTVMSGEKGSFCRDVEIGVILEDRIKNALWVLHQSPKTKVFLLDQPYNRLNDVAWSAVDEKCRIRRVQSVQQFLAVLISGKGIQT